MTDVTVEATGNTLDTGYTNTVGHRNYVLESDNVVAQEEFVVTAN